MNFEQTTKNYLLELKSENVILDGKIIGIDEEFKTATCIAKFLLSDDIVEEKHICVYDDNGENRWKYLTVINPNLNLE